MPGHLDELAEQVYREISDRIEADDFDPDVAKEEIETAVDNEPPDDQGKILRGIQQSASNDESKATNRNNAPADLRKAKNYRKVYNICDGLLNAPPPP